MLCCVLSSLEHATLSLQRRSGLPEECNQMSKQKQDEKRLKAMYQNQTCCMCQATEMIATYPLSWSSSDNLMCQATGRQVVPESLNRPKSMRVQDCALLGHKTVTMSLFCVENLHRRRSSRRAAFAGRICPGQLQPLAGSQLENAGLYARNARYACNQSSLAIAILQWLTLRRVSSGRAHVVRLLRRRHSSHGARQSLP